MRRLLVNDMLSALPGNRTFWNDLQEWCDCDFMGAPFESLVDHADTFVLEKPTSLIIRNASYFGPLRASERIPTISLLQDIFEDGQVREMQEAVICSSKAIVTNSDFTASRYVGRNTADPLDVKFRTIPLPVDFSVFEPGNAMGLQQSLSLPDGCVGWVGASQGAAGHVKGWDLMLQIARMNPDLSFACVFKDTIPSPVPPNMRCYCQVSQEELSRIIGACRVGLCTSRIESQHLAGIEMGACGLPLVVPNTGIYWNHGKDWASMVECPGLVLETRDALAYGNAIRASLKHLWASGFIRDYWKKKFDRDVIKAKWTKLIEEVENGGTS